MDTIFRLYDHEKNVTLDSNMIVFFHRYVIPYLNKMRLKCESGIHALALQIIIVQVHLEHGFQTLVEAAKSPCLE